MDRPRWVSATVGATTVLTAPDELAPEFWTPPIRRRRRRLRSAVAFVGAMAAVTSVAVSGAVVIAAARDVWVDTLRTPSWTPPTWTFPPMWVAVYLFAGLAGWRLLLKGPGSAALTLWTVSLGLHLGWVVIFFGLWLPEAGFVTACVLGVVTLATLVTSWPHSKGAVLLMLPVLGWIGFISTLNYAVATLN